MYEAIIFDLGGVIEKINPDAVAIAFKQLGMSFPEQFFSLFRQSEICSAFELGNISKTEFINFLIAKCQPEASSLNIEKAWCANQLGITNSTLMTLEALKRKGLKLILLSNTNTIHVTAIEKSFYETYKHSLKSIFDATFYSFEMRARKPNAEAYQYVLAHSNLLPAKCIYIDDLAINLTYPQKLGMHCIHNKTNQEINALEEILKLLN